MILVVKKKEAITIHAMKKKSFSHWRSKIAGTLAGKILIAHPLMDGENFAKTIVFIESDDAQSVSGVVLNRPINIMMKALGKNFENISVSNVPVYCGGPDEGSVVTLTAWVYDAYDRTFEIYHTLNEAEAIELMATKTRVQLRAFLGCCNFGNEIYDDIERGLWVVGSAKHLFGAQEHDEELWQCTLLRENPNALIYNNGGVKS
jgi:putative transcriptional regulator